MTGFKPRISGVGSDRSSNCATTTAQKLFKWIFLVVVVELLVVVTVVMVDVPFGGGDGCWASNGRW